MHSWYAIGQVLKNSPDPHFPDSFWQTAGIELLVKAVSVPETSDSVVSFSVT